MTLSMMLQSKISKTKKKLSDPGWYTPCLSLSLIGLLAILIFCARLPTMSWKFGLVESQLPIMYAPISDKSYNRTNDNPKATISKQTPALVLTPEFFYFGMLDAFTEKFSDVRNKYYISHIDGRPQVEELLTTMARWERMRYIKRNLTMSKVLVFLPSSEIPVPIVIQVIHWLKESKLFEDVVLATGLK